MKVKVEFVLTARGSIVVEAKSEDEAMDLVGDMNEGTLFNEQCHAFDDIAVEATEEVIDE